MATHIPTLTVHTQPNHCPLHRNSHQQEMYVLRNPYCQCRSIKSYLDSQHNFFPTGHIVWVRRRNGNKCGPTWVPWPTVVFSLWDTSGFTVTECGIHIILKTTVIRTLGPQMTSQLKSWTLGHPSKSQLNLIRNNFNPQSLFSTEIKILNLQGIMYLTNYSKIKQKQIFSVLQCMANIQTIAMQFHNIP